MRAALLSLPIAALMLSGCMSAPKAVSRPAGPDPAMVRQIIASAAVQVKRCYRVPRIPRAARRITTVIEVHFSSDGMIDRPPVIVSQEGVLPETRFEAQLLAQAAIIAVQRCAPLSLPPELYVDGWDAFELTFGFAAVG